MTQDIKKEIESAAERYGRKVALPEIRSMFTHMSRGTAAIEFGNSYKKGATDFYTKGVEAGIRKCINILENCNGDDDVHEIVIPKLEKELLGERE